MFDEEGAGLLSLLPNTVAHSVAASLSPLNSTSLFRTSRAARDLVLQHCGEITYGPGADTHDTLSQAASRKGSLKLKLRETGAVETQPTDKWLAGIAHASLRSTLRQQPWTAVTELTLFSECYGDLRLCIGAASGHLLTLAFPALQRCTLANVEVQGGALFAALATCQTLRHLIIRHATADELAVAAFATLAQASQLSSLDVQCDAFNERYMLDLPALPPNLTRLALADCDDEWLGLITADMAQRLQEVELRQDDEVEVQRALISHSWPALRKLELPTTVLGQAELDHLLAAAPKLHSLSVEDVTLVQSRADAHCSWRQLLLSDPSADNALNAMAFLPLKGLQELCATSLLWMWLYFYDESGSVAGIADKVAAGASNLAASPGGRALLQSQPLRLVMHECDNVQLLGPAVLAALSPLRGTTLHGEVELCCDVWGGLIQALHDVLEASITSLSIGDSECDLYTDVQPNTWPTLCDTLPAMTRVHLQSRVHGACSAVHLAMFCMKMPRTISLRADHLDADDAENVLTSLQSFGYAGTLVEVPE
uniref:F-box domain-containing protein n=1 Tax=Chlamydomonas leiostraca TaxID=1034604 RepID=A0A7S0WTP9_9CHLO|mmetsp:Transcript_27112/g.68932  ORF Transcript_27112/g.68932 Transcript_27112/m.68932 type:complete len:541 (+) Transcript_27112:28-1650(+)